MANILKNSGGTVLANAGGTPLARWANGRGVLLDGISQNMVCDSTNWYNASLGSHTYSCWFRMPTIETAGSLWGQQVVANTSRLSYTESGNFNLWFVTLWEDTNTPTWNNLIIPAPGLVMDMSLWHHLICLFDSDTGTKKIYIDGILRSTTTQAYMVGIRCKPFSGSFLIGGGYYLTNFPGNMDEFAVFSVALTDGGVAVGETATGEIAELYNGGVPTNLIRHSQNPKLRVWYRLGDDGDAIGAGGIHDASGNGNSATTVNMTAANFTKDTP